jgi:hypothetical protein
MSLEQIVDNSRIYNTLLPLYQKLLISKGGSIKLWSDFLQMRLFLIKVFNMQLTFIGYYSSIVKIEIKLYNRDL